MDEDPFLLKKKQKLCYLGHMFTSKLNIHLKYNDYSPQIKEKSWNHDSKESTELEESLIDQECWRSSQPIDQAIKSHDRSTNLNAYIIKKIYSYLEQESSTK